MNGKPVVAGVAFLLAVTLLAAGCGRTDRGRTASGREKPGVSEFAETAGGEDETAVLPTSGITVLEDGLSAVRYDGDYGFGQYLAQGGASSDAEVAGFLTENILSDTGLDFLGNLFGCSTISVKSPEGDSLFGRNFDWENCEAMVVAVYPQSGYSSVSTVNMDFIRQGASGAAGPALQIDSVKTIAALYAPLDGLNEKGLAVAVNMIQDSETIDQTTEKPDLTTTTAVRLLLDRAATVEEALGLLNRYDMHASMGMMVHFALSDSTGRSVAVEYVENEMTVTETPVVTNFYLVPGEKNGIGTAQSHERYERLMDSLQKSATMTPRDVRDVLDMVSKDHFGEFESTEWSIVFNQTKGEARYYHRENYEKSYLFRLES